MSTQQHRLVGHMARDSTAIAGRERFAGRPKHKSIPRDSCTQPQFRSRSADCAARLCAARAPGRAGELATLQQTAPSAETIRPETASLQAGLGTALGRAQYGGTGLEPLERRVRSARYPRARGQQNHGAPDVRGARPHRRPVAKTQRLTLPSLPLTTCCQRAMLRRGVPIFRSEQHFAPQSTPKPTSVATPSPPIHPPAPILQVGHNMNAPGVVAYNGGGEGTRLRVGR